MNKLNINKLLSLEVFSKDEGWLALVAIGGYAGFGIANVLLFSAALKKIPASAGFGIWTGLALLGNIVIDHWVLGVDFTMLQGFFALLLLIGIMGLRISTIKNHTSPY